MRGGSRHYFVWCSLICSGSTKIVWTIYRFVHHLTFFVLPHYLRSRCSTAFAPSYLENHQPTPSNLVFIWTTETIFFLRKHPQVSPPSKSTYFLQDYEIFNMSYDFARISEIEVNNTFSPKVVCCKDAKHLHIGCGMKARRKLGMISHWWGKRCVLYSQLDFQTFGPTSLRYSALLFVCPLRLLLPWTKLHP